MVKLICRLLHNLWLIFGKNSDRNLANILPKFGRTVRPNVRWKCPNRSGSAEPRFRPFGRTLFANVPQEYQWILGLLSPIAKDLSLKLLIKIVYKSAGLGSTGAKSCKFPVIHYITTKHAVFLAIVVGNVSTPLTTYCIIATDFAKTVYTALKIIRNKRRGKNVEGKHL